MNTVGIVGSEFFTHSNPLFCKSDITTNTLTQPPLPPPKGWNGVAHMNALYMDSMDKLRKMRPLKPRLTTNKPKPTPLLKKYVFVSRSWADMMDEEDGIYY